MKMIINKYWGLICFYVIDLSMKISKRQTRNCKIKTKQMQSTKMKEIL